VPDRLALLILGIQQPWQEVFKNKINYKIAYMMQG
jgi:hypothetical protein